MPKPSEKYRGEDRTLEAIWERAIKIQTDEQGSFDGAVDVLKFNRACDELAAEMKAEGLNTTAATILSHKSPVVSDEPLPSGLEWSEIPDFHRPVHQHLAGHDENGEPEYVQYQTISGKPL